jgi:hypothetical protein
VERRRDTERERSKKVRSMPGRKRERDNHKKEGKTAWKVKGGNTRRSVIIKT